MAEDNRSGGDNDTAAPEVPTDPAESTSTHSSVIGLTNIEEAPGRATELSIVPEENNIPIPVPPRTSRPAGTSCHHDLPSSAGNTPYVHHAVLRALTHIWDSASDSEGQFFEKDIRDVERTLALARQLGGRHSEEPHADEAAIVEEIYRIWRATPSPPTPAPPNTRANTHLPAQRHTSHTDQRARTMDVGANPPPLRQARVVSVSCTSV
jgi:hypothetical protein